MHDYYRKNEAKLKKELNNYLSPIAPELEQELGVSYAELFEETWACYRSDMLEHFPYIGGDKSSGTRNLTGAFGFVALGVVCRRRGMTLERWGYLSTLAYERFFAKFPGFLKKLAGKVISSPRLVNRLLKKKDAANPANAAQNPGSFETRVQPPTKEYPAIYHTVVCPLANFARDYGYMDYMPYICNLDYAMFGSFGVPFYREKTCADGDGCCDFKLKPGAPIVPAWPCHAADPDDPLK